MKECRAVPVESSMKTATSSPGASPQTVRVPPAAGRPFTSTRPAGSLVDAVTVTVPLVAAVVVMP
jgi:hypothetical protein